MRLDQAFERVVVITLPFKRDRQHRLERYFETSNVVRKRNVVWERAICGDWTPPPAWWGAGNGAWGCLMSHVRIAQNAVHDKLDSYCVLEDDVVFHPRANEILASFMKELPSDWGQIYLGGQFLRKEPEQVSPWVMLPYNVNRTHAFALAGHTIPNFLQHVLYAPDYLDMRADSEGTVSFDKNGFHIDHQLGRAHECRQWMTYAPTWWLAGQDAGSSNISGRTNPRLWWHWRDRGHHLPFFFIESGAPKRRRNLADKYLHVGNNRIGNSLVDIGIADELDDRELLKWLKMIAGEAIERWKLPGFEVPETYPNLPDQVRRLWSAGLINVDETIMPAVADYPFNGYLGGVPIAG